MGSLKQEVFARIAPAQRGAAGGGLTSGIGDHMWEGPARHQAAFTGRLVEWSYEALGWVAAYVAESVLQQGVRTPVLLTIRRL
ncbi:hypothetical protein [Streptomonospora litoralis]|uniref:Uncharacterized protein n=1 Tax=Streptomonospora litoralis TaxID=2498135 RepID=A0A4P6Q0L0_9ACTN|nr:hypothetical protein [Streptomonospora litoralis]QBI53963.1 hypothetical protein EKD16_10885 [Streptomonospora litoralis]